MDILELIFGNFAFIFVLMWILGSIFGQNRSKNKKPNRPRQGTPPYSHREPGPTDREVQNAPDWTNRELERVKDSERYTKREEMTEEEPIDTVISETKPNVYRLEPTDEPAPKMNDTVSLTTEKLREKRKIKPSQNHLLHFDPSKTSQLVQGVVWAEILGPPRSRQPHARTRRPMRY
jgi:hypothetical protein